MFDTRFIRRAAVRSSENPTDRRNFLIALGAAGVTGGAALAVAGSPGRAAAATSEISPSDQAISDSAILNFALNLEYLEAEFYLRATRGTGLPSNLVDGIDPQGPVTGGKAVPFQNRSLRLLAQEIAQDELSHVSFLRTALGGAKVSRPAIDFTTSFTAAARAAGLVGATATFDPFADEQSFLLAAFLFEDVGVTAYKGAAPLIYNKTYLGAAAGILAVEAYHAGAIRKTIFDFGLQAPATRLSNLRDAVDGSTDDDQGLSQTSGFTPTDASGIAYGRLPSRVLNIVYLTPNQIDKGGFFPQGVNGAIVASGNPGSAV
ncbi:ferritin-like protein [Frigoribacterium sp. PhB160]|uniref:ferritin-like domain-containing protein n=1 Tax=Frigoribacterium sp. PhB160 TaxID=2485192 RepID=UPI000F4A681A|nr:ferritin-like domain-containing protein [Frigoribacterium sp. PhB160]ROS62602.1 ferritin-like protein [Frigoribacterium sp. PhB160]